MELLQHIKELSLLGGISGREDAVREYIINHLPKSCNISIDPLGNVLVFKKGKHTPPSKLYLSAHMDEVGFIVTTIQENGYLAFTAVGGVDSRVAFGKPVLIGTAKYPGVIGGKPIHLIKEKSALKEPQALEELYIDIGANTKNEAEQWVSVGDSVVFYPHFEQIGEETIVGKALDDRVGCALLLDLLQQDLPYDIYIGFTTQEEIGCIGGTTLAYAVNADISIAIENTTAADIAGVDIEKIVCRQNGGPVISFMDRGTIYNKDLYHTIRNIATTAGIPNQTKEGVFGGNEAKVMQTAQGGSKVAAISLPARYLHSPASTVTMTDISYTKALLNHLIAALPEL